MDWDFNNLKDFDSHVREQLPWYEVAADLVARLVRLYAAPETTVYDIGAGTGYLGACLTGLISERNLRYLAVEPIFEYRGPGIVIKDKVEKLDLVPSSCIVSFLSLMFIPPHIRVGVISKLREALLPGGRIICVERFEQDREALALQRAVISVKLGAGADPIGAILKEEALAGIQVPLRVSELGKSRTRFFQFADFRGYILR